MNLNYFLLKGLDIPVNKNISIKQHTMDDIENIFSFSAYEYTIYLMTRVNYEFEYDMEDEGLKFNDYNNYDIMFYLISKTENPSFTKGIISNVLTGMTGKAFYFGLDINKKETLYYIADEVQYLFEFEDYVELSKIFKQMFFIKSPKRRIGKDSEAKKLIRRSIKRKKKNGGKYDIYSIISSILWHPNSKETHDTIWNRTPYQIYNGYKTIEKISNFEHMLEGVYSGNVKSEDFNRVADKINWINKI